ncbi:alginate export family protein [Candidatus Binatia bacterium]|nr:alginate export family protein [Candidatus Binatia bacterium]
MVATQAAAQSSGAAPVAPPAPTGAASAAPRIETDGPWDSRIRLEIYDRFRAEFVDWFTPPSDSKTPDSRYNFVGNKLQVGVRVTRAPYEMFVQVQDSTLGNVPSGAVGPGGTYYANTMSHTQNGVILRNAWAQTKSLFGLDGLFLKGGRQLYYDGVDVAAKQPNLKWIQANRIGQRLIGPFDYTHVGRSFDGGQVGFGNDLINVTAFGFRPTYGGYEVDANRELDIDLGGLSLNLPDSPQLGNTIGRLFWFVYHDYRDVVYVDNRPLPVRQATKGESTTLHTIGANAIHVEPLGPGFADGMAYGFGQFGNYQDQKQSAWAYGVEAGYQVAEVWSRPWLRLGIDSASGDPNPDDDLHQTFFQMLPTAWLYAQFPFYNMMNNQDVFVQALLDPHPMVSVRTDFHWLRVNSGRDLAYFGGGATKNDFFGFGGVPADGRQELAYLAHVNVEIRPTAYFKMNAFFAHAWGQGVIAQNFTGSDGNYGYLEGILSF